MMMGRGWILDRMSRVYDNGLFVQPNHPWADFRASVCAAPTSDVMIQAQKVPYSSRILVVRDAFIAFNRNVLG